ncbi:MAG: hypothetical protein EBS01_05300, partial [Verrucomicrobia bacterium]|nr:hypothetical protein [Verrucomicrobiota bacterium]
EKLPDSVLFALERVRHESLAVRREGSQGRVSWLLRVAAVVFLAGMGWFYIRDGGQKQLVQLTALPGADGPGATEKNDYSELLRNVPYSEPQVSQKETGLKHSPVAQTVQGSPEAMPVARVSVISPSGAIVSTRPTVEWSSGDAPGQRYDVWILSSAGDYRSAPSLFKAENVVSPVEFSTLKPGRPEQGDALEPGLEYRVLICLAGKGRLAGVPASFRVAPKNPQRP